MNKGKVIWFDAQKGIGFIAREGDKDLFVHWTNIEMQNFKTLKKDQEVEFELGQNHKGDQAVKVKVLSE